MNNDKELLELAAKAEGDIEDWEPGMSWNPLTDDGDALRLAVKLGLVSNFSAPYTVVELPTHPFHALEDHNNDPYAATRRAIVRAAAEIGKGMT